MIVDSSLLWTDRLRNRARRSVLSHSPREPREALYEYMPKGCNVRKCVLLPTHALRHDHDVCIRTRFLPWAAAACTSREGSDAQVHTRDPDDDP